MVLGPLHMSFERIVSMSYGRAVYCSAYNTLPCSRRDLQPGIECPMRDFLKCNLQGKYAQPCEPSSSPMPSCLRARAYPCLRVLFLEFYIFGDGRYGRTGPRLGTGATLPLGSETSARTVSLLVLSSWVRCGPERDCSRAFVGATCS